MRTFSFNRPADATAAIHAAARSATAQQGATVRFLAGGTTLIDLMKLDVEQPHELVDLNRLGSSDPRFNQVTQRTDGALVIGAMVRNAELAHHPIVQRSYPVLSQALLSGASAQLRNMASTGGNLLQRTRCMYFRDTTMPCNKRVPGSGCAARNGANRMMAILGTSAQCIASNPSDMNVALVALGATVVIRGPQREREVPMDQFHLLPGDTPSQETVLQPGELVTAVVLPPPLTGTKSIYLKLRDRASYEFALASTAAIVALDGDRIRFARVAMGGVGTKPWHAVEAERVLNNAPVSDATFAAAADAVLVHAQPQSQNGFKVEMARRCLIHALNIASGRVAGAASV
ncbi:FAD-binding molybdopterin dehydrogenase [Robbsia andropogonis]|uniref:FAD-binding molybdopterin dehydrogenase n=3 Tax=Robbsia andropogonis TaxID=28092 RepID=A0A0F5K3E3_9BURK|nr:xanthine dehydrogenase family protein subunit M [Robbsia andropogonis]KKB64409.1 FAD-binding molybdopterin dehydrogenase [Robbsia andropogonis]